MKKLFIILSILIIASGCATHPNKIAATRVSPLVYKDYDCDMLALEMDDVAQRTTTLYVSLKNEANADAWQMAGGLVLLWPMLFFLEGSDSPEASEYANLKGSYEALRKVSMKKRCNIDSKSPEDIMKESAKKEEK